MKCENEDCTNIVDIEHVEHLCAGYIGGIDCEMNNRFCSCCLSCRQECINDSQLEEQEELNGNT